MAEQDLADRIGIARSTLQKIEKGDPQVDIGFVFEAAVLVGQSLFVPDATSLASELERIEDKLTLMPGKIRKPKSEVQDDF